MLVGEKPPAGELAGVSSVMLGPMSEFMHAVVTPHSPTGIASSVRSARAAWPRSIWRAT
jgi:hypothetical protein